MTVVQVVMAVVLTEAAAELLTESRITNFLRRLPGALGDFFGCGYCASVWIGCARGDRDRAERSPAVIV